MKAEKSLQKLTDSEAKIQAVLTLDRITQSDIETFDRVEEKRFNELINKMYLEAKGEERDRLLKKIELVATEESRNRLWENNQNNITWAIATLIQEGGRMPSQTEIALKTGLSRQTVNKHLKEFASHPLYLEQVEQFRFLNSKVLAKVYHFAVNGDTGAAKLYFNVMGCLNGGQSSHNTLIQNQQNNIQINNTILSQETVKHLNPEQLNTIEEILKTALPET
jgi:biotin operon repressor